MAKILFFYFPNVEALVDQGNPKGGSLTQTLFWMKAMHQLGHDVYQVKFEDDNRELLDEYNWIKLIPIYHSEKFRKRLVWFSYRLPKIFRILNENNFDFVYFSMPHWTCFFTAIFCKLVKSKQIIRIANDKNVDRSLADENAFYVNLFCDSSIRISDFVLAQNKFQFDVLQSKYHVKKLLKISNPILLNDNFLNKKLEYSGHIAWLANFRHQKNLKLLFEIVSLLKGEMFKIAGQPLYPLDEETEFYYEKLKELSNVEFVGILSRIEVLDFLNNAKFLLSTSRYEGFSNTFLESMVTGTPILTTSAVNPDGIIDSFSLGFIYESPEYLKEVLENMALNDYLNISKNCIEYVQANHDHLVLGKKLLDFLGVEP